MTALEYANLKQSVTDMRALYATDSPAYFLLSTWLNDVDGLYNGNPSASIQGAGVMPPGTYTVATLPTAASMNGLYAMVSDSNIAAPGTTVTAGGAVRKLVKSNGTLWQVQ